MDEYVKSLIKMDRLTPDGVFVVPSTGRDYDIRAALALVQKKGGPLTENEIEQLRDLSAENGIPLTEYEIKQFKFAATKETA